MTWLGLFALQEMRRPKASWWQQVVISMEGSRTGQQTQEDHVSTDGNLSPDCTSWGALAVHELSRSDVDTTGIRKVPTCYLERKLESTCLGGEGTPRSCTWTGQLGQPLTR